MRVKIGNKIYDSKNLPILIELEPEEREDILSCIVPDPRMNTRICSFPKTMDKQEVMDWVLEGFEGDESRRTDA